MVRDANSILGLGPICADDIENAAGNTPEQRLLAAVLDFLRKEIGVKEEEVKDGDIEKVFPAAEPDLKRVLILCSI